MSLPTLFAAQPLIVPAKTYDKIWIEVIEILAPNPNSDANAIVRLRRFNTDENGIAQTEPESYKLEISNLIQESQNDPELASLMTALMSYIAKVGVTQGLVAQPE